MNEVHNSFPNRASHRVEQYHLPAYQQFLAPVWAVAGQEINAPDKQDDKTRIAEGIAFLLSAKTMGKWEYVPLRHRQSQVTKSLQGIVLRLFGKQKWVCVQQARRDVPCLGRSCLRWSSAQSHITGASSLCSVLSLHPRTYKEQCCQALPSKSQFFIHVKQTAMILHFDIHLLTPVNIFSQNLCSEASIAAETETPLILRKTLGFNDRMIPSCLKQLQVFFFQIGKMFFVWQSFAEGSCLQSQEPPSARAKKLGSLHARSPWGNENADKNSERISLKLNFIT